MAAFISTVVFVLMVKSYLIRSPAAIPQENLYHATSTTSGAPTVDEVIKSMGRIDPSIYQQVLSWQPRVFHIRNLLTAQECNRLIQLSASRLSDATVDGYDRLKSKSLQSIASRTIFTGKKTFLRSDETTWLDDRLARLLHLPQVNGEDVVVRQLNVGDGELRHVDYFPPGESAEVDAQVTRYGNRHATLVLYLNDDYTGGEMKFPLATPPLTIPRMKRGDALLYYNVDTNAKLDTLTEHEASKIESGTKWVAVKWFRERKIQFTEDELEAMQAAQNTQK